MTDEIQYVLIDGEIYAKSIKMDAEKTVQEEEKPFKCSICNAAFTCEKNVRIHAQLSHNMSNLKLETFSPTQQSVVPSDFNSQIRIHDGKNIMKTNSNMEKMYSKPIEENTSRLIFQCELCNLNFEHEQDLHVHKWVHFRDSNVHLANKPSEVKKQFPCLICTHTYDQSCKLKRHVESVHEGIRFPCTLCSKTFTTKYKLKRHIRTAHEGTNPVLNVNKQLSSQENFQSQVKTVIGPDILSDSVTIVNEELATVNGEELITFNIQELSPFNNQEFITFDNQELIRFNNQELATFKNQELATFKNQELTTYNSEESVTFNIQELSPFKNQEFTTFDNQELIGFSNEESKTFKNQELTTFNSEELTPFNNVELEPPEMVISTFSPYEILQPSFDTPDFNILSETTETKLKDGQKIFQKNIIHEENKIESNTQNQDELTTVNKLTTFNELTDSEIILDGVFCGKPQVDKLDLSEHISEVHEENQSPSKQYQCYICNAKYHIFGELKKHIEMVHVGKKEQNGQQNVKIAKIEKNSYFPYLNSNNSKNKSLHEGKKHNVIQCSFNAKGQIVEEKKSFDNKSVHERKDSQDYHPNKFTLQILNEEKEKPIKCLLCNLGFEKETFLKDHISIIHYGVTSLDCDFCDASFVEKSKLKNHKASVHEGKKLFKCTFCDKAYIEKSRLKKHLESHNTCGECNIEFASQQIFLDHINTVHTVRTKSVKTEEKKHLEIPRKMNYKCLICPYVFQTNRQLGQHYSRFHEGKIPENVELKKKRIRNKPYLSVNYSVEQLNKSSNNRQQYKKQCAICKAVLSSMKAYTEHRISIHNGMRTACQICNKNFIDKRDLQRHEKVRDKTCYNTEFTQNNKWKNHLSSVHEDQSVKKEIENNSVHEGGKHEVINWIFNAEGHLVEDRKSLDNKISALVHEEKKPMKENIFQCNTCYEIFTDQFGLTKHRNMVHEKKPYLCDVCHCGWKSKSHFNQHMSSAHKRNI